MKRIKSGHWIDAETGEVLVADLPRRLQSVVDSALVACTVLSREAQLRRITSSRRDMFANEALRRRAEERLADLQAEHDETLARLAHGWGWCDRHRGDDRFTEREDYVLGWIREYEALHGAIAAVKGVLS